MVSLFLLLSLRIERNIVKSDTGIGVKPGVGEGEKPADPNVVKFERIVTTVMSRPRDATN